MLNKDRKPLGISPLAKIRKKVEFQEVFKSKRRLFSHYFSLYYRQNELKHGRFGSIASSSNLPSAVSRNRMKRMIREQFRLIQDQLKGIDFVIVVKNTARDDKHSEQRQCLTELLSRLMQQCNKA